jgi:hypothetical protein
MEKIDVTAVVKRALYSLFLEDLLGTSIGVILGIVADGFASMAAAAWPQTEPVFGSVSIVFWIAICVTPFALNTYLRRPRPPREFDGAMAEIRMARRRGDISEAQARLLSQNVLNDYIARVIAEAPVPRRKRVTATQQPKNMASA